MACLTEMFVVVIGPVQLEVARGVGPAGGVEVGPVGIGVAVGIGHPRGQPLHDLDTFVFGIHVVEDDQMGGVSSRTEAVCRGHFATVQDQVERHGGGRRRGGGRGRTRGGREGR